MEPSNLYPFAPGSLEEVVAHLALWGETVPDGLARVEYFSEILRDEAVQELKRLFESQNIPFNSIDLPQKTSATEVSSFLIESFRRLPPGVVTIFWSEGVFPDDIALEDSLRVLNFRRESLVPFPLRQIWWMPFDFARRMRKAIADLDRWFFVRLELTQGSATFGSRLTSPIFGDQDIQHGVFMVPMPRNPFFVGRESTLQALEVALHDRKSVLLTQAISGLGGIGKTQTACEYAYRHRGEYKAVLWTSADNETTLNVGYRQIAHELNLPEQNATESHSIRDAVRFWLQNNEDYLLILDNADSPETLLPFLPEQSTGHVLLTSRARQFPLFGKLSFLSLETLSASEASDYLLQRIYPQGHTDAEGEAANELGRELGGFPLALELACSYIVHQHRDILTYLKELQKLILDALISTNPQRGHYPEILFSTWEPNYKAVEQQSPAAVELLNLCAFLDNEAIPFEIFLEGAETLGPTLGAALKRGEERDHYLLEILALLANYSLISLNDEDKSFAVHPLMQSTLIARMDKVKQDGFIQRLSHCLATIWPGADYSNWNRLDRLAPHQLKCIKLSQQNKINSSNIAALCNDIGVYKHVCAEYSEAETLFLKALEIQNELSPYIDESEVGMSYTNLASLYVTLGRFGEAESLIKEALAIWRRIIPLEETLIATSLSDLARLYRQQRRYDEAEPLLLEALKILRQTSQPNSSSIATVLNNSAVLFEAQRRFEDAKPLYEESLSMSRQHLPKGHPDIAESLNNLAGLYTIQKRYDEAEPLYQEALAIRRQALPSSHPNIALTLNNIAWFWMTQGKLTDAEPFYEEALTILENTLGKAHPDTKYVRQNYDRLRLKLIDTK